MEDLGLTKKKAMDLLQELEAFGLLEKKRRGHGMPNILYVKNFMPEPAPRGGQTGTSASEDEPDHAEEQAEKEPICAGSGNDRIRPVNLVESQTHSRGSESGTSDRSGQHSRGDGFGTQEVPKTEPLEVQDSAPLKNQTDNYTYRNQTESNLILSADHLRRYDEMRSDAVPDDVVSAYQQLIRENIDYSSLIIAHSNDRELIDGIVDLILETALCRQDYILIASNQYPASVVKSKFLKLNYFHIEYVLECLHRNTTKVTNIRKYLLAVLFNAPSTMDGYYQAAVQHDMPQLAITK